MSELCDQQEQSKLLLSSPVDKNLNEDKDVDSTDSTSTVDEEQRFIKNQRIQQFFFKMYLVFKEIAIILFVAITYAALTNDAPKLSKSPAAFPFFPRDSIVTDWYHGELSAAIIKARESDIAFVMFYASWDAESQLMRKEFDLTARYMQKEISFAAVNCWQPNSECRKQYSKAYSWPVLIAYPTHGKGIQYKGPQLAPYMVKFLKSLSRPFVRVYHLNEVNDLLTEYDMLNVVVTVNGNVITLLEFKEPLDRLAVILGCVDVSPGSNTYGVFYTTALRFLEKDPLQEVVFALLTDPASCYDNMPSLSLHMWNETLLYTNTEWKSNALLTWVLSNLHQVSTWHSATGSKSLSMSSHLQPGPALILFTPRNPLTDFIDYYALLHEVALEYYNCGNNPQVQMGLSLINDKRKENHQNRLLQLKLCSVVSQENLQRFPSTVTFAMPKKWANNSCLKCESVNEQLQSHCEHVKPVCETPNVSEKCDKDDTKSAKNLIKYWQEEKCRIASIAETIHSPVYSEQSSEKNISSITGWACKTNSSLKLIALDSLRYFHFAERLGMDLSVFKDKTAAVIINQKAETHHILNENVNDKNLREFINNFTVTSLPRAYNSETTIKTKTKFLPKSGINILELNSESFFPVVMQDNKAVMVFYYSKQCSFCSGISYTFLTVAKMFRSVRSVQFTRIDGDSNILPWAFTMDRYPTIIYFPMKSKSESRVFPRDIPITISNLVSFILVNSNPSLKLHVMWALCNQTKYEDEREFCVASLRAENLSVISNTLRAWRSANLLTKTKLLYKLQQLRNINLLLAHSPDNEKEITRYLNRLHRIPSEDVPVRNLKNINKQNNLHDEL